MPFDSILRAVSPDEELDFSELAEARRQLYEDVRPHRESVNFFSSPAGFVRVASEVTDPTIETRPAPIVPLADGTRITGVTTALTCFESLNDAILDPEDPDPRAFTGLSDDDADRLSAFTASALKRTTEWRSEGAARRYCIVRAVAPMVRLAKTNEDWLPLEHVIREVWEHVGFTPGTHGIYEVTKPEATNQAEQSTEEDVGRASDQGGISTQREERAEYRYPPNAFLTYWGIRSLKAIPGVVDEMRARVDVAATWLYGVIGREIALHSNGVHDRDPQQLAWGICGVLVSQDEPLADRSENTAALIAAGLKCFFDQQLPSGSWETGRALFHYPEAGNAYCYIFETLAELITLALDGDVKASTEFRRALIPYVENLLRARDHLVTTTRALGDPARGLVGWSSGHHPHRTSPESWATATAYRFLQALRRLVGWITRERAGTDLQARRVGSGHVSFGDRGWTWDAGRGSAGDVLASLFVNPQLAEPVDSLQVDPDRPLLDKRWARSALLFGPPGTGKTQLAKRVAGRLGWNFIEITPADFLNRGTEFVSARADEIFRKLLEVDGAVVLFDEIDELIRDRTGTTDMLGRFFTTTMLPRLARLWDARKLIFFVNTNCIGRVDPAIRRSQRFDAAIFVLPPCFERKVAQMPASARKFVSREAIYKVLRDYPDDAHDVSHEQAKAAWLTFLRFDQLPRLAEGKFQKAAMLNSNLVSLGEEMFSDWALVDECPEDVIASDDSDVRLQWIIEAYRSESKHQRVDPSRLRLVATPPGDSLPDWLGEYEVAGYARWKDGQTIPDGALDGTGNLRKV